MQTKMCCCGSESRNKNVFHSPHLSASVHLVRVACVLLHRRDHVGRLQSGGGGGGGGGRRAPEGVMHGTTVGRRQHVLDLALQVEVSSAVAAAHSAAGVGP